MFTPMQSKKYQLVLSLQPNAMLSMAFVLALILSLGTPVLAQPGSEFRGVALGPQINTPSDESSPRLSPNGNELFFVRTGHDNNLGGQDIWQARKLADGSWSTAKNLGEPLNNDRHNAVGGVSGNGKLLYLSNTYDALPSPGISKSRASGNGWNKPESVLSMQSMRLAPGYFDFFVDQPQNIIILSMTRQDNPREKEDLYFCRRLTDGTWEGPYSLGEDINTAGAEISPSLSSDGSMMFFATDGRDGEGSMDIFVSQRLDDSWQNWSEPTNLGDAVNTPGFDAHFIVDGKDELAYFSSGPTKNSPGDLYSIQVSEIPILRREEPVASADTLRVFAKENTPLPISFEAFGVPNKMAPLSSGRSLDGKGNLIVRRETPAFVYQPAPGFSGKEHLELTVCDPPHSDDCKKVIVLAEVEAEDDRQPPKFVTIRTRTPKNTPVKLDLGGRMSEMTDLERSNAGRDPQQGLAGKSAETGGEHVYYRPANNFTGIDTLDLFVHCDNPNPEECILAKVIVDVYEDGSSVAVVDPTPVDPTPVDPVPVDPSPVDPVPVDPVPVDPVAVDPTPTDPVTTDDPALGELRVFGNVTDAKTGNPVGAELVFLELPSNKVLGMATSGVNTGYYEIKLTEGTDYAISVKEQYHFETSSQIPASARDQIRRDITMGALPTEVGTVFQLKNIYFDVDKATLKPESREELTRLYSFMKDNPSVKIRIEGHTDDWSDDEYNITLSQNRSQAVVNYLKYKGVMGTRLEAKGFGETLPVADNANEEGRALNRRVEFRITAQ